MPPGSGRATGRSTISGGYTEQMPAGSALLVTPEPLDPGRVVASVAESGDGAVCIGKLRADRLNIRMAGAEPSQHRLQLRGELVVA